MKTLDTDLMAQWEKVTASIQRLKKITKRKSASPEDFRLLALANNERESLIFEWNNLLVKRRRGELTDETHTAPIVKEIDSIGKIFGMPIQITVDEGNRGELLYVQYWMIQMQFSGEENSFDEIRWKKFVEKVSESLQQFDHIDHKTRMRGRNFACWFVHTWPWLGPFPNKMLQDFGYRTRLPRDYYGI